MESVKLLLMLLGRGVRGLLGGGVYSCGVMRGCRIVNKLKRYSVSLRGVTYRYVLLADLKVIEYYKQNLDNTLS